jgi:large subunit ribosomal protein L4
MGTIRTPIRKGGGVAFAKLPRDFSQRMPKKQRRLARDSAILSKLQSGQVVVVDELNFAQPKTREFARILKNLKIDRSCLVAIPQQDVNLYKSARNVPKVDVMVISDLNAGDICSKKKMLFTKDAFLSVVNRQSPLN